MNIKENLKEMFKMQNELNEYTNGKDWKSGKTNNNEINWIRCIIFELFEAIDQSFQWKHWKNNKEFKQYSIIDLHNLKIELVDTYHFLMSEILKQNLENEIYQERILNKLKYLFSRKKTEIKDKNIIENIEKICLNIQLYNVNNNINEKNKLLLDFYNDFFIITSQIMEFEEFYNLYIKKNVLNLFRQKNGYQTGKYIKNWGKDKIEDNVILKEYLDNNENLNFSNIYLFLEKKYIEINSL